MEDGASTPNTTTMLQGLFDDTIFDYSLMDEILYDGFWLETTTTDESDFRQPGSIDLINTTSFYLPTSETAIDNPTTNNPPLTEISDKQALGCSGDPPPPLMDPKHSKATVPPPTVEESERNNVSRLWVGPNRNDSPVKTRLVQAINCLKDSIRDKDVLIQIWVPIKKGNRQFLTTNDQPFSLPPSSKNLAEYRDASRNYHFAADKDSNELAGLPGRVFLNKLPEWTPDVRFFKREEYPRVSHAQQCDVRGSLALPVFQRGSGKCLGVVEIVTTTQKVQYRPELENVCKALEAFDLKSSNVPIPKNVDGEDCYGSYRSTLMEIRNILKCVCEAHELPLAQAWAPCVQQGKGGCRHTEENYARCVSTIDLACCVADQHVSGFHEACSEHHLLKGEGIVGRAFLTNQPCFADDITVFSKSEYPLAHHARVFNLHAAVAIRLRSTQTGASDFVLELFLPVNCRHERDQRLLLDSLSSVIQRTCQSLRVVTDEELAMEVSGKDKARLEMDSTENVPPPKEPSSDASSWVMQQKMVDKGKGVALSLGPYYEEEDNEFKVVTTAQRGSSGFDFTASSDNANAGSYSGNHLFFAEKKRTKTEKTISLEMLRQYFAGSLKDAAKSIGVCPTTLKRICRQHGITRWPSRKIKKVGHSLKKLQRVIDSVQGAEGSIQLRSFYASFPELASSGAPETNRSPTSEHLRKNSSERTLATPASVSASSSGSHSSSSSYGLSAGVKHSSFPENNDNCRDGLLSEQAEEGKLKRTRSDAQLVHDAGHGDKKLLMRSHSHKVSSYDNSAEPKSREMRGNNASGVFRVKASFGEEKIRFSLQPHWSFKDLRQEVLRRFNIDSGSRIDMKYLDDDSEWVLLTCDADLEECVDIHMSFKSRTIKLSLNQAYNHNLGSSIDSNGPC